MKNTDSLKQVKDFHLLFDHPVLDSPQIPSQERCTLRTNLLQEELDELKTAIKEGDIVAIADALTDIQFVLSGTVLEFGLGSRFSALNNEVYRSNMSKACASAEEAAATCAHHENGSLESECSFYEKNGSFFVQRNSDKKTMKSINYSPADLKSIVGAPDSEFEQRDIFDKAKSYVDNM